MPMPPTFPATCASWLEALGFTEPTPVQAQAVPPLAEGRSVHALAPTGTGKTLAFLLPVFARTDTSSVDTRVLVLVPTRELGQQIAQVANALAQVVARGGAKPPVIRTALGGQKADAQKDDLRKRPHLVVATPGRALEFVQKEILDLSSLTTLVLDEADTMVGMGFAPQVEAICERVPRGVQTGFFSATATPLENSLEDNLLAGAVRIDLREPGGHGNRSSFAKHSILRVDSNAEKYRALSRCLRGLEADVPNGILFCATREEVSNVSAWLTREGHSVDSLSGELGQVERTSVLRRFKAGGVRWLVATNVAARGIDVTALGVVVNVDLPANAEDYVHRAGRTGRAGREARVLNVATEAGEGYLRRMLEGVPVSLTRYMAATPLPVAARVADAKAMALEGATVSDSDSDASIPTSATDLASAPAPAPANTDFRRVHLNRGKADKLRAGDVVGALTKQLGLAANEVGGIFIFDHFTHVDVAAGKVATVIEGLAKTRVKALTVKAEMAKADEAPVAREGRRPFR